MREIKFRYTCVKPLLTFHCDFTLEEIEGGKARRWQEMNITAVGKEYRRQYTGLKDKNGKEVCEGDIVRAEGQSWNYIQVIEFHNSKESCGRGWIGRNIFQEESFVMKTPKKRIDDSFSYFCWPATWEIIGNIYDHPHLLNSDDSYNY